MLTLPIGELLPALLDTLAIHTNAVLTAPPGSGKTTRIPLALLNAPWLAGRRILMLEPRRLATRAAAHYMASLLGESVGETVGYRMRLDTKVGKNTRIEVVTEGVLTRMLQTDPGLDGVGVLIFDEFHERSLQADLGLAFSLQAQAVLRPDLRILIMSATIDSAPVAELLDAAPVLTGQGQLFPVETRWLARPPQERLETAIARQIIETLTNETGDILVFLPGEAEIRRVESLLLQQDRKQARIAPLYGSLSQAEQDQALLPSPAGQRKVVLATAIAETSLTVEGVRVVIDSGLMRAPRFSPRTGMTRLETVAVSKASADQRRGRAGRLGPGICWRMWTKEADGRLEERSRPEILEADLAPLALQLAAWGTQPQELKWLDMPPAAALAQAQELLQNLGALAGNLLTDHGRRLADSGLHPRLAHMIVLAQKLAVGGLGCDLAALLSERDVLRNSERKNDADLRLRLEALQQQHPSCRQVVAQSHYLRRWFGIDQRREEDLEACGLLLCFAYPDRIAQRRADGRFLLTNGRGASFTNVQPLSSEPYICIAELDDKGPESRIYLAAPVTLADLKHQFNESIQTETQITWDREAKAVRARRLEKLGALVLSDVPMHEPDSEACIAVLLAGVREEGLGVLPWSRSSRQFRQRVQFMQRLDLTWPDLSDEMLISTLENWLAAYVYAMKSVADLQRLNLTGIFESMLTWEQRQKLDEYAPTHLTVPSGQRLPLDYSDPEAPSLAVRLQELFGMAETPRIGQKRVPLTLRLLSPAQRPVQVTKDLASFWRTGYFAVKKELLGRYPKHYWPDDPLQATPTHRVRPSS
ncbi:ATP-dependent helicase [Anaerosporomusa subterranea]|uniref:ATP-dependent helicase n=1 Tax=Anaerosporomusa subterranea TaxID=1794912 RepID=A0A154BVZ5_ANASB|nr:ATP-dependent helicase HrpB [Anaerosporomusa subterranea]KYZ78121.1 ATP-dependent helicase [Anaerosporomusa subterranea]